GLKGLDNYSLGQRSSDTLSGQSSAIITGVISGGRPIVALAFQPVRWTPGGQTLPGTETTKSA
ncbi:MAG: hypothetical protein ACOCUY_03670, partial [Verrucomicrobiota bacterium]